MELSSLLSVNRLVFSSIEFLFRYFPVFLAVYFLTPAKKRKYVLFFGSVILYSFGNVLYTVLLLVLTLLNYYCARLMRREEGIKPFLLVLSCGLDVLVLGFFKVLGLFDVGILMPLGISFYIFKLISIQADTYTGKAGHVSMIDYCTYVVMFPQITSGPIYRYEQARKGIHNGEITSEGLKEGVRLLIVGLGFKVILADTLAILWNDLQTIGFESISTPLAWLGAVSYSMELYFDFQGYSLMALGIGSILGFEIFPNFMYPYSASGVSDFWRKWHISLGNWFRDYIYIPLGGNRKGKGRTVVNLLAVWLLTGLWHGSGWNFVIWGLLLGAFVILERMVYGNALSHTKVLKHVYVCVIMPITWIVFAITDLKDLGMYLSRMFPFFGTGVNIYEGDFMLKFNQYRYFLLGGVILNIPVVGRAARRFKDTWTEASVLAGIFFYCVYRASISGQNPFMYFNF